MRKVVSVLLVVIMFGCNPHRHTPAVVELVPAPEFDGQMALDMVKRQVEFGPRIPNTEGHLACGNFLVYTLSAYGFTIVEQRDTVIGYDGVLLPLRNIIASTGSSNPKRILLCAHWDSRPFSDQDTKGRYDPITGANDNGSGVAVLLEIARNISIQAPQVGVDLVFFDLEDQGRPAFDSDFNHDDHGYCLGSEYWAKNKGSYDAEFGILVDMVGAKDAIFTLEGLSISYSPDRMRSVWDMGHQLGYGKHFQHNLTKPVHDDHVNVNEIAGIPCIDIIQHDASTASGFGTYWHTHHDNLDIIDQHTLKAVGQTILQVVYNEPGL